MSTPFEQIFAHRENDDGVELRHFLSQCGHSLRVTLKLAPLHLNCHAIILNFFMIQRKLRSTGDALAVTSRCDPGQERAAIRRSHHNEVTNRTSDPTIDAGGLAGRQAATLDPQPEITDLRCNYCCLSVRVRPSAQTLRVIHAR